jgi:hypothetical protein
MQAIHALRSGFISVHDCDAHGRTLLMVRASAQVTPSMWTEITVLFVCSPVIDEIRRSPLRLMQQSLLLSAYSLGAMPALSTLRAVRPSITARLPVTRLLRWSS